MSKLAEPMSHSHAALGALLLECAAELRLPVSALHFHVEGALVIITAGGWAFSFDDKMSVVGPESQATRAIVLDEMRHHRNAQKLAGYE